MVGYGQCTDLSAVAPWPSGVTLRKDWWGEQGRGAVTTLPAKAGSVRALRSPWLRQEFLRLRLPHPPTLPPEGPIQAHWSRPRLCKGEPLLPVFLPSRGKVPSAIPTAEHRKGPQPPSTRDTSYPQAFPMEPCKHIVGVTVPPDSATIWIACQVGAAPLRRSRTPRQWGGPLPTAIRIPPRLTSRSPLRRFSMDALGNTQVVE
jgi:hypothetical protein